MMKTPRPEGDMNGFAGGGNILNHLRVLDLADQRGSFCSRLLADMGAQVIKVEVPGGDPARWRPEPGDVKPAINPAFSYHNRNKRGVTLNLAHEEGRLLFLKLVTSQHVIVDTFAPGYLEGLGLGDDRLAEKNPGLICVTLSDFGNSGPNRFHKSCDLVASAVGGHMAVTGKPAGAPLRLYGNQTYNAACLFAACAILMALHKKNRTGKGAHLTISLQEAVSATLEHVMVRYFSENTVPKREGGGHWNHLFEMLPCRDGHIQMTVFENWDTLLELMDQDGAAADLTETRWQDPSYRLVHKDHLLDILGQWTRRFTRKELFDLGQLLRFPWGPVQRPDEILVCPQLSDRGFFQKTEGESAYDLFLKMPFKLSGSYPGRNRDAPSVGEHNYPVYRDEAGLDDGQIERLVSRGII
jgi:crotonobetainyl-CoA:carnitine CoA-transferase CaiB-like acyl-CoA transferase